MVHTYVSCVQKICCGVVNYIFRPDSRRYKNKLQLAGLLTRL